MLTGLDFILDDLANRRHQSVILYLPAHIQPYVWEFTRFSNFFLNLIREGPHARILCWMRDVQRLAGKPFTCCCLIETAHTVV
jgi:hypothetical protein